MVETLVIGEKELFEAYVKEEFLRSLSDDDPRWGCDSKYYGSRVYDLRDSNLDMGYMEDDDYSE